MLYVRLDVHRRRTQVAALDEDGYELFNRNVPNDVEKLGHVLVGFEPGTPVVFEARSVIASDVWSPWRPVYDVSRRGRSGDRVPRQVGRAARHGARRGAGDGPRHGLDLHRLPSGDGGRRTHRDRHAPTSRSKERGSLRRIVEPDRRMLG